jgi:potassium efflux system protein
MRGPAHPVFRRVFAQLCVVIAVLWAGLAAAQDGAPPDYEGWAKVAQRAEISLETGRASTGALEALRSSIADWRQQFLDAQGTNGARIETLQSQLGALGEPAEGESDTAESAERRAELTQQLVRLRSPVIAAEEAYLRANGIVSEIDSIIRDRQTTELIKLGPSPLNLLFWGPAFDAFSTSWLAIGTEIVNASRSEARMRTAVNAIPRVLLLLAIGFVLLLRGHRWSDYVVELLRTRFARRATAWRFIASLAQIVLPALGVVAIASALFATGLIGLRGTLVLDNFASYAVVLLTLWWLGEQLFPRSDEDVVLPVAPARRAEARFYIVLCGLILCGSHAVNVLAHYDAYSPETRAVLGFPILIVAGLILFRVGMILRGVALEASGADDMVQFKLRITRILGQIVILVAFVIPAIAAFGYGTASARLMFASVATLALLGMLLVLQGFVRDLYDFVLGREGQSDDSLIPVLIGFALVIAALPVLALIWGARLADLSELWTQFQEGFAIGESRISPADFMAFVVIFAIGYMATRLLQGAMRSTILPRTKIDTGGRNAIVSGIGYVGIFFAALIAISSAGLDLSSLAIVAGALSVGIGFGLQNIVSNFVSGIILLIERPIAEGDWIEVGGKMGYVRGISVRSTRIETFDRTDVIVPNADLASGMVTNWTRGKTLGRIIVPVGVAYGNDTRKVEAILLDIARTHEMVLMNPAPSIVFQGFGADSLDFEIRAILRDVNFSLSVKSEINHQIYERFAEEGIEIPYAQRDIWIRNPEALASSVAQVQTDPAQPDGGEAKDEVPV